MIYTHNMFYMTPSKFLTPNIDVDGLKYLSASCVCRRPIPLICEKRIDISDLRASKDWMVKRANSIQQPQPVTQVDPSSLPSFSPSLCLP